MKKKIFFFDYSYFLYCKYFDSETDETLEETKMGIYVIEKDEVKCASLPSNFELHFTPE